MKLFKFLRKYLFCLYKSQQLIFLRTGLLSFVYHAWVGVRDIWMDYIKPVGIRLALQIFTILWLLGCGIWVIDVLWRV